MEKERAMEKAREQQTYEELLKKWDNEDDGLNTVESWQFMNLAVEKIQSLQQRCEELELERDGLKIECLGRQNHEQLMLSRATEKIQSLEARLDLAERLASFIKNKRFFLKSDFLDDANELLDQWYKLQGEK